MRPQINVTPKIVATVTPTDSAICHSGGVCTTMRVYITSGAVNGKMESATTLGSSGTRMARNITRKDTISGINTNIWICCASCSELTAAPNAAHMEL